jgi:DNA-binding winged helix-turn-helix (wHTH) protein
VREPVPPATVAFHNPAAPRAVRFGPFRFDWRDRILTRDGAEIRLPPRALAILAHLLERPGRVVAKQELIDAVWKEAFVSESSLTEAVGVLRQALGDSAADAIYIQTLHRRGYRFIGTLQFDAPEATTLAIAPPHAETDGVAPRRRPYVIAAIVAGVAAVLAGWLLWRATPAPLVTRTTITLPDSMAPAPGLSAHTVVAVSPDGRRLVYVAGTSGSYRLYLRALDRFDALPIPGTEGGHGPFFSPDGESIGFFRRGRLLVSRLPDGEPLDIGAAGAGLGGWWHTDHTIFVATGTAAGIVRVADEGGRSTPVVTGSLNPAALRHPSVAFDDRTLLATVWRSNVRGSEVAAVDLETGASRIIARGVHPRSLSDTEIAYLSDGTLTAAPLDGGGEPRALLSGVMTGVSGAGQYTVARLGTLVYIPDSPTRKLRRLRRIGGGRDEALPFELRAFQNIAVSPDGHHLAATIYDRGASDHWAGGVGRGNRPRLTSEGGGGGAGWSADGRPVCVGSTRSGDFRI